METDSRGVAAQGGRHAVRAHVCGEGARGRAVACAAARQGARARGGLICALGPLAARSCTQAARGWRLRQRQRGSLRGRDTLQRLGVRLGMRPPGRARQLECLVALPALQYMCDVPQLGNNRLVSAPRVTQARVLACGLVGDAQDYAGCGLARPLVAARTVVCFLLMFPGIGSSLQVCNSPQPVCNDTDLTCTAMLGLPVPSL